MKMYFGDRKIVFILGVVPVTNGFITSTTNNDRAVGGEYLAEY